MGCRTLCEFWNSGLFLCIQSHRRTHMRFFYQYVDTSIAWNRSSVGIPLTQITFKVRQVQHSSFACLSTAIILSKSSSRLGFRENTSSNPKCTAPQNYSRIRPTFPFPNSPPFSLLVAEEVTLSSNDVTMKFALTVLRGPCIQ